MAVHALVMGFGGTGTQILTFLKEMSVLKYGKHPDSIKFLEFDTIARASWKPGETIPIAGGAAQEKIASGEEISLNPDTEYFPLMDSHPSLQEYVTQHLAPSATNVDDYIHLKDWLHTAWFQTHINANRLNIRDGAAQQRQIGRFAMFQNVPGIMKQFSQDLNQLISTANGATIQIWLVGSVAGGTGAGTILDAAFLTRLAAEQGQYQQNIQISGVFVLPEIYQDHTGISEARAYSLFRELDRFQDVGIQVRDKYALPNGQCSSEISYDKHKTQQATISLKLFDNLFYLGIPCKNDDERTAFFTSIANALDPYLDEKQGPTLLANSINPHGG
ncbi:MAG: hypothetical protein KAH77_07780, partial [Thiomargarita sp.]|nr:hypothetical protein [Thiomargarita sp.]